MACLNLLKLYIFVTICQNVMFCQKFNVTVVTSLGTFIGFQEDVSIDNKVIKLSKFLGIPYAEPPIGQLRFQKPVMKTAMTDPLVTQQFGPDCLQLQLQASNHSWSEDCLHLNVFAPVTTAGSPLAVMIWIHGGGYVAGASSIYYADLLASRGNVVMVTVNYRLGPIGFLNLGFGHESNFGLWDQQLAIQWVHNNIGAFGGDKNRVTIFGESAGGGSVIYQGLYSGNQGLFHRIIAESGTASTSWSETLHYKAEAYTFAASVGCTDSNPANVLKCLKNVSSNELNDAINNGSFRVPVPFAPSVDNDFIKISPKKTLNPRMTMDSASRHVFGTFDVLAGTNAAEGAGSVHPLYGVESDPEIFLPNKTFFDHTLVPMAIRTQVLDVERGVTQKFLTHAFTNWSNPDDPYEIRQNFVKMHGDIGFIFPCLQTLDVHKMVSNKSTYMYYFTAEPKVHMLPSASWIKTSNHGDELRYVFGETILLQQAFNDTGFDNWEKELSKNMMTMWSNFAKTGNPNLPTSIGVEWKPFSATKREYLQIGKFMNETLTKEHLIADKYNFWNSLRPGVDQVLEGSCVSTNPGFEDVRLANGTNKYSGRVEILHDGQWRTVCANEFDHADAVVVCRMLAFPHPEKAKAFVKSEFGHGIGKVFMTDLHCNGLEANLDLCKPSYSSSSCYYREVAGVDCCPTCAGAPQIVG